MLQKRTTYHPHYNKAIVSMAIKDYLFVLLLISFCNVHSGFAQYAATDCDSKIEGTVHDTQHEALVGVSVWIKELKRGTVTDERGVYTMGNLCAGKYTLVFSFIGFKTKSQEIEVKIHQAFDYSLELTDDAIHLEEVAIIEERLRLEDKLTQNTKTLSKTELNRLQGNNLGNILKNITGVTVFQTGSRITKPVIQGMHSNRIQVINNGIRQEGQQWGAEHAPEIDPFLAKNISVIKGAAALEYGVEAIGGAIIVSPPDLPTSKGIAGEFHTVGMSNGWGGAVSGTLEGSIGNIKGLGARIQGTFRQLGDSEAANYVLSNTGVKEINFSAALGLKREKYGIEVFYSRFDTDLGILSSAHIGNTTDLYRAISTGEPAIVRDFTHEIINPRQKVVHQLFKTEGFLQLSQAVKLSVLYGLQFNQRDEFDIRRGGRSERPALSMQLLTQTFDASLEYRHHQHWQGKIGTQSIYQDNFNDVARTGSRRLIPDYEKFATGLFWVERLVKDKWEAELGLRYDYIYLKSYVFDRSDNLSIPERNFHNISANAGFIYYLSQNTQWRTNLGISQRNPHVNELYSNGLHHAAAAIEEGDANLQAEQSFKIVSTLTWQKERWQIELSPYYHHFENYIFLNPREIALTIRGAFPVFNYTQQQADFFGLDASLQYELLPHLFVRTDMAYMRATGQLIWMNPNRFKHTLYYEKPNWGKLANVFAKIEVIQVSRQHRAPEVIEDIENIPSEQIEPFDFAAAPAGYALLNLSFGSTVPFKKSAFTWSFEVENIFNTAYRDYMNRYRYFADDMGRNFTLRLSYSFGTKSFF